VCLYAFDLSAHFTPHPLGDIDRLNCTFEFNCDIDFNGESSPTTPQIQPKVEVVHDAVNRLQSDLPALLITRTREIEANAKHAISKNARELSEQGFTNLDVHPDIDNDPMVGIRRVGDKRTWVYNLNTTGITFDDNAPPVPDSVIETATLKVGRNGLAGESFCTCHGKRYRIRAGSRFSHCIFKHSYTTLRGGHLQVHDPSEPPLVSLIRTYPG
jgi:hypothetical protein